MLLERRRPQLHECEARTTDEDLPGLILHDNSPTNASGLQPKESASRGLRQMTVLKKLILWNYSRETSVYVIFCLLIVAFIFLTPKSWFDKREPVATQTSRLIVQQKDFSPDRAVLEKRVRELSGRPDAEIVATRETKNGSGETIYEIDIK